MRAGMRADRVIQNKRKIKSEVSTLFTHKKKLKLCKPVAWKHKFYCLAYIGQDHVPATDTDKDELFQDWGRRILSLTPRLREGGGFWLLKFLPNMEVLSMAVQASPSLLKWVGKSRTYIRPIQHGLDLTPLDEPPIGVSQIVYYIKGFRYRPFYVCSVYFTEHKPEKKDGKGLGTIKANTFLYAIKQKKIL